ncbi:restriction endonuclease subunit S [Kribbella sp. NPDC056861]|uniref:restriction endonuclease subunit S n=1 Tax=Kribbella sp. NPDC056861 TaxID=3154857 RepID=UPI0034381831
MSDWEVKRLDDVADRVAVRNSAGHQRVLTVSAGRGLVDQETYFNKRVASADLSGYWVVEPGDFVYNKSTSKKAPWGVVARWNGDEPAVVTTLYIVFRARPGIEPDYLLHACNGGFFFDSLKGTLREGARAHGLLNVRLPEFFGAHLDIPSLAEQHRIVDAMAAIDTQISAAVLEKDCAVHMLTKLRVALLSVGLEGDWQSEMTDLTTPDTWTENLPSGWSKDRIGTVATVRSGATPRRSEQERYFDGGNIPWVKTGDLNERVLAATDECITEAGYAESSVRLFPAGTILIAMYGGFAQIGRTARLGIESTTNQAISAVTSLRGDVDPAYLHHVLKAGCPKWRLVAASSRKDPNISKRDVERFDFPLPPIREQFEIVKILDSIESSVDALTDELIRVRTFRSSLIAALLNREVEISESYDAQLEGVF